MKVWIIIGLIVIFVVIGLFCFAMAELSGELSRQEEEQLIDIEKKE